MKRVFALLLLLLPLTVSAQHFGGNPPSLKWRQINTDTVRVIFPAGLEPQGKRVSDIVHYLNRNARTSIGNRQQKVSIVLQNQTLESNGYVQLGPFRSEFYLAPPPSSLELGSLPWDEQLALHEYRHVLQNMNFRQGISKVFSYLGGELGQAAITNIAVPNWFWEGDAVTMETALSPQGRGRLPAFFDGFRALTLAGKQYSYMKIRNGSYRDYVPDHYELGYLMSTYGRNHYGQTFWRDVTTDAVRFRGLFYPLSQSLRRRTGHKITGFYQATMQEYQASWKAYAERKNVTPATQLNAPSKVVTNYRYVYKAGPGQWIVLKSSYQRIPGFYLVDSTGREQLITRPGSRFDDFFSYSNGRLLWTEARFDARWAWKDYSIIKMYDRANGHTYTLTHHTKYFSPDVTADGQYIVAAFTSPELHYGLHWLNARSGALLKALPNPENWYYTFPRFTASGDAVISPVRNSLGQMALVQQNISSGETTILAPFSYNVIGAPVVAGDTVYFTGSWKDANNIYAVTLGDKKLFQVTDRPNSVLHAAVNTEQQQMAFTEFTAAGYTLYEAPLQPAQWQPVDTAINAHSAWLKPDFKEGGNILSSVPHDNYPVQPYSQAHGLFNLHSWVPTFDDPDYSLTLYGNNILNTTSTALGYTYNRNEGFSRVGGSFLFGGWFPWLQVGMDYTFNRSALTQNLGRIYWNELDWYGGITVPLILSSGLYGRSLSLGANYHYLRTYPDGFKFRQDGIQYINSTLVFNNQRIKAPQNIYSHFGQYLYLQYTRSIDVSAYQFYGRFDLYLPGLFPNHNLVLQGAYQKKDASQYSFTDNFVYARGYNEPFYAHIYKVGANYHFPIAYPDWGFAQLLYLMRLRGNVFYDYSKAYNPATGINTRYASTGGELFFDTKIGNTIPFTFGMRYSRLLDRDPAGSARNRIDFILPLQQLFSY